MAVSARPAANHNPKRGCTHTAKRKLLRREVFERMLLALTWAFDTRIGGNRQPRQPLWYAPGSLVDPV